MSKPDYIKSKAQVELENQIAESRKQERELKKLLDSTDHKTFSDYEPREGEDVADIIEKRSEWRAEIREVQQWLEENAE